MEKPKVITWFNVYAIVMIVIYVLLTIAGVALFVFSDSIANASSDSSGNAQTDAMEFVIMGIFYVAFGVVLAIAFVVGLLAPRKFWAWVYNLVLICLGLTSCCFWPITIPLLIFWLKDETKQWYKKAALTDNVIE